MKSLIEFKPPSNASSDEILASFKDLIYHQQTDKPLLILVTGTSLSHPKVIDAEKYAFKNQNIMRLVEIS
jgi:hypothetical protein